MEIDLIQSESSEMTLINLGDIVPPEVITEVVNLRGGYAIDIRATNESPRLLVNLGELVAPATITQVFNAK
jgi:hypothetical protein